jgi:ATP-dependent Clp protease ATP-binding subunit ClpX
VELSFTDEALKAIARKAMEKKTGARGLRAIIERCMLDVMFDVPSSTGIKEVIITHEVINDGKEPELVMHKAAAAAG